MPNSSARQWMPTQKPTALWSSRDRGAVELGPMMPQTELAKQLRRAHIVVSPSTHDGTPNSLLEAIACGCFPIAGNIESIHEWIRDSENGLLVDPTDPQALAQAIIIAITNSSCVNRPESQLSVNLTNSPPTTRSCRKPAIFTSVWQAANQAGGHKSDE